MRFISFVISYFHKFSKKGTYVTREMLHILLLGYHKKTGPSPEPVNLCINPCQDYFAQPFTSWRLGFALITSRGNGKYSCLPTSKLLYWISAGSV